MDFIKCWKTLCESEEVQTTDDMKKNQDTDGQPGGEEQPVKHTVEEPVDNDEQTAEQSNESESGPVHYALVANIKNGLFKKDDSVFVCHLGSSDKDGNITTTNRLTENDGAKMMWDGKNDSEFGGYKPNEDNDWDYIHNFAQCGKNEEIMQRVKDHYGPRFRGFAIREYYPTETDTFIDHIDPSMMKGLCPYCR